MSAGSANKRHTLLSSIANAQMIRPVNNLFFIENDLPTLTTARSKHRSNCSKSNYCYLTFHCLPCRQLPSPTNTLKCRWREWNDSQARGGTSAKHLRRLSLRPKNYFSLFFFLNLCLAQPCENVFTLRAIAKYSQCGFLSRTGETGMGWTLCLRNVSTEKMAFRLLL